jgi:hypothetical protein
MDGARDRGLRLARWRRNDHDAPIELTSAYGRTETRRKRRGNVDAHDHLDRSRGRRHPRQAAAPEPVNGRWNLRGRTVQTERLERGVVPGTALHAHVAEPRRCRMSRYADRLTRSLVDMGERRVGRHTNGQTRCRSYGEEPHPHRSSPSRRTDVCFCSIPHRVRFDKQARFARLNGTDDHAPHSNRGFLGAARQTRHLAFRELNAHVTGRSGSVG